MQENRLAEAIDAARQELKEDPGLDNIHFLLFELYSLDQDFQAARNELEMIQESDFQEVCEFFSGILTAEELRYDIFSGMSKGPAFVGEPPAYATDYMRCIRKLYDYQVDFSGDSFGEELAEAHEAAAIELAELSDGVPLRSGTIDGKRFDSLRDADDRLAPFLEAVIPGTYFWLPFEEIRLLEFLTPRGYPDLIWRPTLVYFKGQEGPSYFFVPALCPAQQRAEGRYKTGAMTGFHFIQPGGAKIAYGQKDLQYNFSQEQELTGIRQVDTIVFDD